MSENQLERISQSFLAFQKAAHDLQEAIKEGKYEYTLYMTYPFTEDFNDVVSKIFIWSEAHKDYLTILRKQQQDNG
ncbi:hypothetical protein [Heliorestis convoluta]|uniref:Uncharacterized protein n=1 Tax=Heliorestis convoluta TaxID=356322 RepID=A0A5Q2N8K4_9FIRM|nr:hypothetical protein [Heliorestis convoluta]QGG48825.1 hypothetical protein FTV88_2736 [Heliorestis convoluta]